MTAPKKGIFGYRQGLNRYVHDPKKSWVDVSLFLVHGQEPLEEEEPEKPTFSLAKGLVTLMVLLLVWRLTGLQIAEGSKNRYLAEGNRIRRQITTSPRGAIVDKKGESLVSNEAGYSLDIIPADLPKNKKERESVFQAVADVQKISPEEIQKMVMQLGLGSMEPLVLQPNLPREQALIYKVKFAQLSGVRVSFSPTRKYDSTPGLSHILGYTSRMTQSDVDKHPDYPPSSPIGRSGVESSYDTELRGSVGISEIEVNANGQYQRTLQNTPPQVGKTLRLSLDKGLQSELAAALEEAMSKNGAKQAAGIAMDPRTGGILASVSLPSYDDNLFAKGISTDEFGKLNSHPDKPLLNRVVNGVYPSGSTIKPFVAAAALQEKTITPSTKLDTSAGVIKIGQWEFPDWKVHGITDVKQAIAESNDIFFYALGGGYGQISALGVERLGKYYRNFGFGKETGLDYASDNKGLIPDPDWKKKVKKESWYIGDTYHIAIGQGDLLVTPLQLVRALSSLLNGGYLPTPHVVESVESTQDGTTKQLEFSSEKVSVSPEVMQTVREGMHQTVLAGSARALNTLPFSSGGKTGTAQFGSEEKTHAWYIGFAPYDNPEIAVAVIVEGGGEGNAISVPVAGRVFQYYMSHK